MLDEDSKRRLQTNPLRILDSKDESMQGLIAKAPKLIEHLSDSEAEDFNSKNSLVSLNNAFKFHYIKLTIKENYSLNKPLIIFLLNRSLLNSRAINKLVNISSERITLCSGPPWISGIEFKYLNKISMEINEEIEKRQIGKSDIWISTLGFGGAPIGNIDLT